MNWGLPEPPPVFCQPFNKSGTEEVAECSAQNCADENGVAREKGWFVKDEGARAETNPTTAQSAKECSGNNIPEMVFFLCHWGFMGHGQGFS